MFKQCSVSILVSEVWPVQQRWSNILQIVRVSVSLPTGEHKSLCLQRNLYQSVLLCFCNTNARLFLYLVPIITLSLLRLSSTRSSCSTCGGRPSCRCSTTALTSHPITGTTSSGRTSRNPWSWSSPSSTHTPSMDHQRSASHPSCHCCRCSTSIRPLRKLVTANGFLCLFEPFTARAPGQQQHPARSNPADGHLLPAGYLPRRGKTSFPSKSFITYC